MAALAPARGIPSAAVARLFRTGAIPGGPSFVDGPSGSINYNTVFKNLHANVAPAFHQEWLADIDAGLRNLDHRDVQAEYSERAVPVATELITAALLNARANVNTARLAPIVFTNERQFTIETRDAVQLEFTPVTAYGVGRATGYNRSARTFKVQNVKAHVEIEARLLADPNFGQEHVTEAAANLASRAQLTLNKNVSGALIDVPFREEMKRLTHPTRAFNHARQNLQQSATCFVAHDDPRAVLHEALKLRTGLFQPDTIVMPQGAAALLEATQQESREIPGFVVEYDDRLRDVLVREVLTGNGTGPRSAVTIPAGDGSFVDVIENISYVSLSDDGEETAHQTLRTILTLGGVGLMPTRDPSAPYVHNPYALDVALADHAPDQIEFARIAYKEALKNSPVFNNFDGSLVEDGFSNVMTELVAYYNANHRQRVHAHFRGAEFAELGNNKVPARYLGSDKPLKDMEGWRDVCGLVRWVDDDEGADAANYVAQAAANTVSLPKFVGDMEPKSLPPQHVHRMAEALRMDGPKALGQDKLTNDWDGGGWERLLKRFLPTSKVKTADDLVNAAKSAVGKIDDQARNYGPIDKGKSNPGYGPNAAYVPTPVARETHDMEARRRAVAQTTPEKRKFYATTAELATPATLSVLVPLAGESLESYKARLTPDALHAAVQQDRLHAGGLSWSSMLGLVPDSALDHFLGVAYEAQKDQRQLSAAEHAALESFSADVQRYAARGPAFVGEVMKKAAGLIGAGKNPLTALQRTDPWLDTRAETRLNSAAAPAMTLAARLGLQSTAAPMDAMDIDEMPSVSLGAPKLTGGEDAKQHKQYSWKVYGKYAEQHLSGDDVLNALYSAILNSTVSYRTCAALADLGLELFRFNYVRPFAQFLASSVIVLKSGPQTMFTALGGVQVLTGINDIQGAFTINAGMSTAVIVHNPKNVKFLPYAISHTMIGPRNTQLISSVDEFWSPNPGKPAVLALPVPVDETSYVMPLSLTNEPAYAAPNTAANDPRHKSSMADLFEVFAGPDLLRASRYSDESYWGEVQLCTTLDRECAGYYNQKLNKWEPYTGTGPLGPLRRNLPEAAKAFMGSGRFPSELSRDIVVR